MNRIARIAGWTIVLTAAFAVSAWSLYVVAHDHYQVPRVLAGLAGVIYDGAALLALDAWSTAARDPEQSTRRPRLAAVLLLATSVYLNYTHASIAHQGAPAAVLYAGPGIVLWGMAELRLGAEHDALRRRRGLGYAPRPAYGTAAWLVRSGRAWRAYTTHLDARLDQSASPAALDHVRTAAELTAGSSAQPIVYSDPRCAVIRALYDTGHRPGTKDMRDAIIDAGLTPPGASTIRSKLRNEVEMREPHLTSYPSALTP